VEIIPTTLPQDTSPPFLLGFRLQFMSVEKVEISEVFSDDSITYTDFFCFAALGHIAYILQALRIHLEKPSDLTDNIIAVSIESLLKSLRSMAGNNVLA
jgi:hypothetical protein